MFRHYCVTVGGRSMIGGTKIHIFVFTEGNNNGFQNKLITQEKKI